MCARVRDVVEAPAMRAAANLAAAPMLVYQDQKAGTPPNNQTWFRVAMHSAGVKKRTLGRPARLTQTGVVVVEIFVPVGDKKAAEIVHGVSALLKGGFASSTDNVDFTLVLVRNLNRDDNWLRRDVQATYTYDTRE